MTSVSQTVRGRRRSPAPRARSRRRLPDRPHALHSRGGARQRRRGSAGPRGCGHLRPHAPRLSRVPQDSEV